ncbi:uncharacterized protein PGRI_036490 [Penicillium griseofulvum]|uniref:Nuclear transport factor 2 family protein n=1 Tax=Penicillium patulum TaxID=5078 RepID=A0A135LD57_PENPA|nr:uncharacterized protein PGRI_036490 [Penicillium griseofulvum]KXG46903.1 hypothetical protein PGRI_036490 [Penicillium griseofulvum]
MDYPAYIASYSIAHNERQTALRFFTDDVLLEDEQAHNGNNEELQIRSWAHIGETVLAELDGVFVSDEDVPLHFFYPFRKGEKARYRFLAANTAVGEKISHIRITYWESSL